TKRTRLGLDRLQPSHDAGELGLVEARSDVADVHERAMFVDAQRQRTEMGARVPRLGPSTDDEFLLVNDLELAPVGSALARLVQRARVLRDQPFPSALECPLVQLTTVAAYALAHAEKRRRLAAEDLLEHGAALREGPLAIVGPSVTEHIEDDQR